MSAEPGLDAVVDAIAAGRASARVVAGQARIILDVSGLDAADHAELEARVHAAALGVAGIESVQIALTASRPKRTLIAVASGKGGVGKSTVSANLAIALQQRGRRVGVVDADIYGPSQPKLLGVEGIKPQARDKVLQPVPTPHGVSLLSMGQFVAPDQAIAWRGLKAAGALGQLVDANWGNADTLVLDLPPGTGDIQLTMIRSHRPAGAVIVSTPQDLALIDARRAIDLFAQAKVPVIGLIENMAGYVCPSCGAVSDPFGHGGAEAAAAELGIAFLGRIPLDIAIRTASDGGMPPAAGNGPEALAFQQIAGKVADWIDAR
ncbi:MAG: Mrp/NBP35 family ATP-binding protein [Sphingomonas sp.]|nr:Mrp/NBP35 family ATP-binding protein [Sphingomonas sp.]